MTRGAEAVVPAVRDRSGTEGATGDGRNRLRPYLEPWRQPSTPTFDAATVGLAVAARRDVAAAVDDEGEDDEADRVDGER